MFPMLIFVLSCLALLVIVLAHGTSTAVTVDQDAYDEAVRAAEDRSRRGATNEAA